MKKINHLKIGIRTIKIEAKGLDKLGDPLATEFNHVCNKLVFRIIMYTDQIKVESTFSMRHTVSHCVIPSFSVLMLI